MPRTTRTRNSNAVASSNPTSTPMGRASAKKKSPKKGRSVRCLQQRDVFLEGTDAETIARNMANKKTKESTKKNYNSKINFMLEYLTEYAPEGMESDSNDVNSVKIPIDDDVLLKFFGYIMASAHARSKLKSRDDVPPGEDDPWSSSQISGFKSAIVALYSAENCKMNERVESQLKGMLDGYEKVINDLKKRGLMKIGEGKNPLPFQGYILLAKKLATAVPDQAAGWSSKVFMWSYLTMLWNLMTRNESVDDLLEDHFDWSGDAMLVEEQGHKGDQTGEDKYQKHVYANPLSPEICPVLSQAVLQFCTEYRPASSTNHQIYDGSNSKDRFSKNLGQCLRKSPCQE